MLTLIVSLSGVLILGALIYLSTLDGRYQIRRSRVINADIETLFDKIRDFRSWPEWSPWLIHEPDCKLTYSDNCDQEGGYYEWDGQHIGAGRLTHVTFERPHKIIEKIEFTRPFKSVCDVEFEFADKDGQTEITWIMRGEMPFLFRFMTKKTAWMISRDYDFGLAMLAGVMDPQDNHPRLDFVGETNLETRDVVFIHYTGGFEGMKNAMQEGFPKLMALGGGEKSAGPPCTLYHKVDPIEMNFDCDICVPARDGIDPQGYGVKSVPAGRYFKATLRGSYEFLDLAWYSSMSHLQMHKIKQDKSRPCIDVYTNSPDEVAHENELVTELYIPVK